VTGAEGTAEGSAIVLVVAVADNGVIGRDGALPWRLPDDLKHFKALTWGKPILMGRRTFDSIGRPLAGRRNLVLTRSGRGSQCEVEWVHSLDEACIRATGAQELCVIGGAELYRLALPQATRVYLTQVHASVAGDTYFPLGDLAAFRETQRVEHAIDARHEHPMSFVTLERRPT
jgi:dihydrofolate reductase